MIFNIHLIYIQGVQILKCSSHLVKIYMAATFRHLTDDTVSKIDKDVFLMEINYVF